MYDCILTHFGDIKVFQGANWQFPADPRSPPLPVYLTPKLCTFAGGADLANIIVRNLASRSNRQLAAEWASSNFFSLTAPIAHQGDQCTVHLSFCAYVGGGKKVLNPTILGSSNLGM